MLSKKFALLTCAIAFILGAVSMPNARAEGTMLIKVERETLDRDLGVKKKDVAEISSGLHEADFYADSELRITPLRGIMSMYAKLDGNVEAAFLKQLLESGYSIATRPVSEDDCYVSFVNVDQDEILVRAPGEKSFVPFEDVLDQRSDEVERLRLTREIMHGNYYGFIGRINQGFAAIGMATGLLEKPSIATAQKLKKVAAPTEEEAGEPSNLLGVEDAASAAE